LVHFERSFDYRLIRHILTHPMIYRHITDDHSPPPEQYAPIESEGVWYILAFEDEEILGAWILHPQNSICWEIHTCLLPHAWGTPALIAGRMLPDWIWEHTPCRRVITNVPVFNRVALAYAQRVGMAQYGVNPASFLKDGKLWDQVLLGISPQSCPEAQDCVEEGEQVCQPLPSR